MLYNTKANSRTGFTKPSSTSTFSNTLSDLVSLRLFPLGHTQENCSFGIFTRRSNWALRSSCIDISQSTTQSARIALSSGDLWKCRTLSSASGHIRTYLLDGRTTYQYRQMPAPRGTASLPVGEDHVASYDEVESAFVHGSATCILQIVVDLIDLLVSLSFSP